MMYAMMLSATPGAFRRIYFCMVILAAQNRLCYFSNHKSDTLALHMTSFRLIKPFLIKDLEFSSRDSVL